MLGCRVERVWGGPKALLLFAFLAAISSAAQIALDTTGVGLSGVVYGVCALLWVIQDRVSGFEGTVTKATIQLFGIWFFVCIALTLADIVAIGNVAHGAGAVAGWLLGRAIVARRRRVAWVAPMVVLAAAVGVGSTVARPYVNLSRAFRSNMARGILALRADRFDEAVRLLEAAKAEGEVSTALLVDLGIAYQNVGRHREALSLYKEAVANNSSLRTKLAPSIASIIMGGADAAAKREDFQAVRSLAQEALEWTPDDSYVKEMLDWAVETEKVSKAKRAKRAKPTSVDNDK